MPNLVTIYQKDGKPAKMFSAVASEAVAKHPNEWSFNPWPGSAEEKPAEKPAEKPVSDGKKSGDKQNLSK